MLRQKKKSKKHLVQDFDIMETAIKDFYSDEINIFSFDGKEKLHEDIRETLIEKLEFDFEMGGII